MLGFFEELGAEAEGWEGVKEWRSEFHEVNIRASNAGDGDAVLDVYLRWPPEYEEEQKGTIHVRTDQLERFAGRMRVFLRHARGRFAVHQARRPLRHPPNLRCLVRSRASGLARSSGCYCYMRVWGSRSTSTSALSRCPVGGDL
jgi:Family of unknown function (DUF6228)